MTLLDGRGRLLGRFNLVDGAVLLVALLLAWGVYTVYSVFRLPGAPEIVSVDPATQTAGDAARVKLRGRDFLPFMRVFVQRSGGKPAFVHENERPVDAFTLVNRTQAEFVVESPTTAEIRLPNRMEAGTYDLLFFDETRHLGTQRSAFTLTPPPTSPPVAVPTALVRAYGAFHGLSAAGAELLRAGARLRTDGEREWVEILNFGAASDTAVLATKREAVLAALDGTVEVPAFVRVHCSVIGRQCEIGGKAVGERTSIPVRLGDRSVTFVIGAVEADFADAEGEADVAIRFVVRSNVTDVLKTGDVDAATEVEARVRPAARIVSIASRRQVTSRSLVTVNGQPRVVEEPAQSIDVLLRVPVTRVNGVWFYRGVAMKSGGDMAFETPTYKARGWILDVTPRATRKPAE